MKVVYKPVGPTPNDHKNMLICKGHLDSYSCFSGRLDPQARGLMVFLEKEECRELEKYNKKDKEYEFEIIFGVSTDTDDIMGHIETLDISVSNRIESIYKMVADFISETQQGIQTSQKYHPYSAFMLRKNGKRLPLWKWIKMGELTESEIPSKNVIIHSIDILEKKKYKSNDILIEFISRLAMVDSRHDYRQNDIIQEWRDIYAKYPKSDLHSMKLRMKVSSGYYIRQFGNDLKQKLGIPLMIYDINRTKII